jgi:hypothetical protein
MSVSLCLGWRVGPKTLTALCRLGRHQLSLADSGQQYTTDTTDGYPVATGGVIFVRRSHVARLSRMLGLKKSGPATARLPGLMESDPVASRPECCS